MSRAHRACYDGDQQHSPHVARQRHTHRRPTGIVAIVEDASPEQRYDVAVLPPVRQQARLLCTMLPPPDSCSKAAIGLHRQRHGARSRQYLLWQLPSRIRLQLSPLSCFSCTWSHSTSQESVIGEAWSRFEDAIEAAKALCQG